MDIYEAIKKRRSVRAYKSAEVNKTALKRILEAMRLAPSAHNSQEYKFVLVESFQKRLALSRAAGQSFVSQAPIIVAAVSTKPNHIMQCGVPAHPVDIAIALDHLTLAATAEGLGTCWIGAFSQEEVRRILEVPEEYKVVALMPLGIPDDKPEKKIRKSLGELICYDNFIN
ncbi:nitroreductase family protein [Patescibacteria group bacterium]|nr:nitroreductase family protein [Patescibacteria group bacterium]MBU4275011.1 nitroreductase family protein [Patescibacteria group bacterium]MBU4367284.1 nitroreductase family protein [Patescibacteria group bacterium]MBU4461999.1 nitroreductase family protein [Patescibacteria group bacterium]MCG2700190.1 nitroreductase family protein [Candidatus Parcubacteria bacterium]